MRKKKTDLSEKNVYILILTFKTTSIALTSLVLILEFVLFKPNVGVYHYISYVC